MTALPNPKGIDVSNNNGPFNWESWHGHIQFAMAKATQGLTFRDSEFHHNWNGIRNIGAYRFAYHYGAPLDDPVKQAEFFVSVVAENGIQSDDNFVLDFEENAGLSPVDASFWAWTFCHHVNKLVAGHRTLVYTYPSFAEAGYCAKLGGHPLWIANYAVPRPTVPPPWHAWTFWQYSGSPLDLDEFNGSQEELDKFCRNE